MIAYLDIVSRAWRIRLDNGEVSPSEFSTEADAQSAIELAFDHSMEMLSKSNMQESRYRRASERAKKELA